MKTLLELFNNIDGAPTKSSKTHRLRKFCSACQKNNISSGWLASQIISAQITHKPIPSEALFTI